MKSSTVIAATAVAAASYVAADFAEDVVILQYALTLEHLEAKFYKDALDRFSVADFQAAGYRAVVPQRLSQIKYDEAIHVETLESVLRSIGQEPTKPCEYTFPYETIDEFLAVSRILEGVGVSAYLGKAPLIENDAYLAAAAAILTVEARHQALVSSFVQQDGAPFPFDTALQGSQVFSLAVPFLKSCPSTNPTLPFKNFADLTVETMNPRIGQRVAFTYPETNGPVYIHFLNGLQDLPVLADANGEVVMPSGIAGTVYVVATNSAGPINDENTVAGPAIIVLENPDATYPTTRTRRSIEFTA